MITDGSLRLAACCGNPYWVESLLARPERLHPPDPVREALMLAVGLGHTDVVTRLLEEHLDTIAPSLGPRCSWRSGTDMPMSWRTSCAMEHSWTLRMTAG
jgi:hypothetical protein